jgi:hypothetical protein
MIRRINRNPLIIILRWALAASAEPAWGRVR